jgi:hypothetical protein
LYEDITRYKHLMSLSPSYISGPAVSIPKFITNISNVNWNTKWRVNDEFTIYIECAIRRLLNKHVSVADYCMDKNNLIKIYYFLERKDIFLLLCEI